MKHYAGLDLSMETTAVCVVDETGHKVHQETVGSEPEAIAEVLERVGSVERAVIETGRMSGAICLGLKRLAVPVVCIDARQAHQSLKAMKANKTDPHDAAGLAQLARTGFYKEVHVKSAPAQGVRSAITARSHLVEERVRLDNAIRGLCAAFGIKVGPGQGEDFVARARAAERIPGLGDAVTALLAVRETFVDQIKALDRFLAGVAKTSTACQILMSIPGVGVQISAAFAAAVDDADRFTRSRLPAHTSAWYPDDTSRARPNGPAGSRNRATVWSASFSTKLPTPS